MATLFYRIVKVLEYETANPSQDSGDKEAVASRHSQEVARAEDVRRFDAGTGYSEYLDDSNSGTRPKDGNNYYSTNHFQDLDFGLHSATQDSRMDGAEEVVENGPRYDTRYPNSNSHNHDNTVGKDIGYNNIRHSNSNRPSTHQSRPRGHAGSGERTDDPYPEPVRAVYQSEDPHAHFHHDRSYYNGPDAESGSADYSDRF